MRARQPRLERMKIGLSNYKKTKTAVKQSNVFRLTGEPLAPLNQGGGAKPPYSQKGRSRCYALRDKVVSDLVYPQRSHRRRDLPKAELPGPPT